MIAVEAFLECYYEFYEYVYGTTFMRFEFGRAAFTQAHSDGYQILNINYKCMK